MKAYCEICGIHEASFRPGNDAKTGEPFEDLCCDGCHLVLATVSERAAIPVLFGVVVRGADMREEIVNPDDPRAANGTPVYTFAPGAKENSNV